MATVDERIKLLEDKLKQEKAKKQKLEARKRHIESKAQRATDTRKKILLGAFFMERMEKSPEYAAKVMPGLGEFLTRDVERALFGLPPLPTKAAPPVPRPAASPVPPAPTPPRTSKDNLIIKFDATEKEIVKALGAKYSEASLAWYVPSGLDLSIFEKWLPK